MISAIIYKELLKSYKIIIIFMIVLCGVLINTYLDAQKTMAAMDATSAILTITQMGRFSYNSINYISILFAITLAFAQFYPEVSNARIRLFLHLPMSHFKLITVLIFIGLIFLSFVYLVFSLFYAYILNSFYPEEVFNAIFSKLLPIFLASILCYLTTMIAFLEPKLIRKLAYILICYLTLKIYLSLSQHGYFVAEIYNYTILGVIAIYILTVYDVFTSYTKGYIK